MGEAFEKVVAPDFRDFENPILKQKKAVAADFDRAMFCFLPYSRFEIGLVHHCLME
ncbi:Uncharacterised protein [Chlamydia trachomatis]|nr:Uncharacterised protein [Chlamydia trachomatis]CRI74728.1 Uncharacterised protein [Chlamydia trachomatis]